MDNRITEDPKKLQFEDLEQVTQENMDQQIRQELDKIDPRLPKKIRIQFSFEKQSIFWSTPVYKMKLEKADGTSEFIYRKIEDFQALRESLRL